MIKKPEDITEGYYIITRFGMQKTPKWVYTAFRAVGGTVAHAWITRTPADPETLLIKEEWPGLDEALDKLEEQIRKEGK